MPKLRTAVIDNILRHLELTDFGVMGFTPEFPDKGDYLCVISFSAEPKYQIKFEEVMAGKISVRQSPGVYKNNDARVLDNLDSAIAMIADWSQRIREELIATSRKKESIEDIAETVDRYIKEKVSEPDVRFSSQELNDVRDRLSRLEERFAELLDSEEITKPELEKLKNVTNSANYDAQVFTKRVWYKTSFSKILSTVKTIVLSKEGRDILSGVVKKQLGLD